MERPTYGDIIGLQPGFERLSQPAGGQPVETSPTKTPSEAIPAKPSPVGQKTPPPVRPAKVFQAAVKPKLPVIRPEPQFVQRVAAPPPPPFDIRLVAQSRPKALLSKSELRAVKVRQKQIAARRALAAKELKAVRKVAVSAMPRDLTAISAIEASRPAVLALQAPLLAETLAAPIPNIALASQDRPTSVAPAFEGIVLNIALAAMDRPQTLNTALPDISVAALSRPTSLSISPLDDFIDIALTPLARPTSVFVPPLPDISLASLQRPMSVVPVQTLPIPGIQVVSLQRPQSVAPVSLETIPDINLASLERPSTVEPQIAPLPGLMRTALSPVADAAGVLTDYDQSLKQNAAAIAATAVVDTPVPEETPTPTKPVDGGEQWTELVGQSTIVAAFDEEAEPAPTTTEMAANANETLPAIMRTLLTPVPDIARPLGDFDRSLKQGAAKAASTALGSAAAAPATVWQPTKPVDSGAQWAELVGQTTKDAKEDRKVESAPIAAETLPDPVDVASAADMTLPPQAPVKEVLSDGVPVLKATADEGQEDFLTRAESLDVIDMVGLPGEAKILAGTDEDRAELVASVKTTSTQYEPRPIGQGGLETLRDAVEHAIATNPDIKIAEAQQEDAFYAVKEARAGFLPKVDLNAGAGPELSRQSGDEEITRIRRELNATLRQTVFDFGLTQFDYRRAKQNYESAKLETLQGVEDLTYDVTVAYLGVLQQQKVVALAHQNLEAHEYILNLVTAQKEAGQGTAADVNRVSSSLSNAQSFMLEEESKLQQARDQYRRLLDAPPGLLVDPLLDLSLLPQTAQDAADRSVTESPRLLQVKADSKSIENQLRSHRGNFLPKVEVEVQGNMRTDVAGETGQTRDARAMMFLRYNAFNGGADSAISARLRARIKEIGYEFEKQRREVEQSIRNDFTAIDASRAKVETIKDQVAAAEEVVRLYEEQFRAGDRTAFDLLDAQQALIGAKLEQVLNSYQENRAAFRVLQQLGSLYYALTADE